MLYLKRFALPSAARETIFLSREPEVKRTCYGSRYPFGVFLSRKLPTFELEPVTILCGGNGSGKTTILNLIGEKLGLQRASVFNRSSFYSSYLNLCEAETSSAFVPAVRDSSRVITSDDVFDDLLDLRNLNENVDTSRKGLLAEYTEKRYSDFKFRSLEDLDELRKVVNAQRYSASRYVNEQLLQDIPGRSNGESAFAYFTRHIQEGGLYLLDEPENSLSSSLQLGLVRFLEDSVRFYGCQFVIATHSPFLLALRGAKIYNLDTEPVSTCRWTDVENVRVFYEFFKARDGEFETLTNGTR